MRRWEELRGELDGLGVRVVAICTDSPAQIAAGRARHGLQATFVADPDLAVTDLFGLRNLNTAVRPPGRPGLPVPTSLLVDRDGVVRWKDQSRDYMQRSNPQVVRRALRRLC